MESLVDNSDNSAFTNFRTESSSTFEKLEIAILCVNTSSPSCVGGPLETLHSNSTQYRLHVARALYIYLVHRFPSGLFWCRRNGKHVGYSHFTAGSFSGDVRELSVATATPFSASSFVTEILFCSSFLGGAV